MDFTKHPISQSLIKRLFWNGEERILCPQRVYNVDILRIEEQVTTDSMMRGNYFETLCLGEGRGGSKTTDLPRRKLTKLQESINREKERAGEPIILGDKLTDQMRIDEQAQRFKVLCAQKSITVMDANVQTSIIIPWKGNDDILLSMNLDIFPTTILHKDKLSAAIIDLKLTADIHSTFGEYCYGTPEMLDNIQGKMYHYGVRNIDYSLNPHLDELVSESLRKLIDRNEMIFLLWIFNYKKAVLEDKFIEIKWDKAKEAELHEVIRKTIALLEMFEAQGWPTVPDYKICKNCPITSCGDRIQYETI